MIVRVISVLNRTVVVDGNWRFDNLCGSHLQSQSELYHVIWWYYTLVIDLIGQLCRDVIGRLSVKPWCIGYEANNRSFTRTIILNQLMKSLLSSNRSQQYNLWKYNCIDFITNRSFSVLSLVNNITKIRSSLLAIPQDLSSVSEYYHC